MQFLTFNQHIITKFSRKMSQLHHTAPHPLKGPLSWTTRVSRYQKGKANLYLLKQQTVSGDWQWHQLGICKSAPRQHPTTQFLQAECPVSYTPEKFHLRGAEGGPDLWLGWGPCRRGRPCLHTVSRSMQQAGTCWRRPLHADSATRRRLVGSPEDKLAIMASFHASHIVAPTMHVSQKCHAMRSVHPSVSTLPFEPPDLQTGGVYVCVTIKSSSPRTEIQGHTLGQGQGLGLELSS